MSTILPGATLGVLGGGQLGKMFVQAAQRMGYFTAVLDKDPISPAGAVAHYHIQGSTDDEAALAQLMQRCAAITTEFENVSAPAMVTLGAQRVVSPSADCVAIAQNRIEEKSMLAQVAKASGNAHAGPVPFISVEKVSDITAAPDNCFPGLLKTATLGYDGKGQVKVNTRSQASIAFKQLGSVPCVLEQLAPLAAECSVVLARNADGQMVTIPVARNVHVDGILASSEIYEGNLPLAAMESAQSAAKLIAEHLQYVGVLCVEFFILKDAAGGMSDASELRVNEIAPRPHNSGHWSIEGSSVSQFELQVRTLCGLPLAQPVQLASSVMLNLLGDIWFNEAGAEITPDWAGVLALPGVSLHLYGKAGARKGRKMGHITVTGASPEMAGSVALEVAEKLGLPYKPTMLDIA
ncbi:MAG: 5-(carboxyamino)imidazole ribonucleotide synthase [Burkholderiales bacterium]|nr:MAG: 5-(carboxyamino)imidazole ribonucleotide synthase [Burkholderiales bacterium]